jgi:hypothetical protein
VDEDAQNTFVALYDKEGNLMAHNRIGLQGFACVVECLRSGDPFYIGMLIDWRCYYTTLHFLYIRCGNSTGLKDGVDILVYELSVFVSPLKSSLTRIYYRHAATFSGLGYVQEGKRYKKFFSIAPGPGWDRAVIAGICCVCISLSVRTVD